MHKKKKTLRYVPFVHYERHIPGKGGSERASAESQMGNTSTPLRDGHGRVGNRTGSDPAETLSDIDLGGPWAQEAL